jgi:head-tail adaptor
VNFGRLRHRVRLEQRVQAADGTVGITTTFSPVADTWAEIQAVKGSVYAAGLQVGEGPTHRIILRWRNPTGFDHISRNAQRWRVRDARDPDGTRVMLEVMAEELAPQ